MDAFVEEKPAQYWHSAICKGPETESGHAGESTEREQDLQGDVHGEWY